MFQFSCRLALFINCSSFKPDIEDNANSDAVSSKRANFDQVQFLLRGATQYAEIACRPGDAENARHENAGLENAAQTCRGWKMRDWKMWHKNAGRENAGQENASQRCRGGKCRNGKSGKRKD